MSRGPDILNRWKLTWILLCAGLAVPFALFWGRLPAPDALLQHPRGLAFSSSEPIEARYWKVIQPKVTQDLAAAPVANPFRLAGTFLTYASSTGDVTHAAARYAILDDLSAKKQLLAHEGDTVAGGFRVAEVLSDAVVLEQGGRRLRLTRSLTPLATAAAEPGEDPDPEKPAIPFWDQPALETNRFGKKIDENRWVLQREKVLDYYNELLERPERLVNLYRSFYPDRKNGEVEGFRLKFAGENDFFKAVGIQEGDTVRMVNSMKMSSQRRAEFFIGEFVRNNLQAIVFDIERDGKEQQLIYLLR